MCLGFANGFTHRVASYEFLLDFIQEPKSWEDSNLCLSTLPVYRFG